MHVHSLLSFLQSKDLAASAHSTRVRDLAVAMATASCFPPEQIQSLTIAAALHDIGKIFVPDEILHKPSALDEDEWQIMKLHPAHGEKILLSIASSEVEKAAAKMIRSHHEALDGTGYPDGLKSPQISGLVRILTIADCYDALTSNRAYRKALAHDEAMTILSKDLRAKICPTAFGLLEHVLS